MAKKKKEKPSIEYVPIAVTLYPDFDGPRITRDVRMPVAEGSTEGVKFVLSLPVPADDVRAKEMYGMDINGLIRKGAVQRTYDVDSKDKREGFSQDEEGAEAYARSLEQALTAPPKTRKSKAKEEKEALASVGVSSAVEAAEEIKRLKALLGEDA